MFMSEFAESLDCPHCGGQQDSGKWPQNGDYVPYYTQKEPGNYNIELECPHCRQKWFVVWDDNPGPVKTLTI